MAGFSFAEGDWRAGIFGQFKACGVQQMAYVPDAGHAPTLDEPEVRSAIDTLLASIG